MVHDIEMLMSQYAEDTTLFFDEDINSYNYAIKILKWFEKISGLAINNDKTLLSELGLQETEAYFGRESTVSNGLVHYSIFNSCQKLLY